MKESLEANQENPKDDLARVKEIDELFNRYEFATVEDKNGQEMPWFESKEAKHLQTEKAEIIARNRGNQDFDLSYAAYEAPREGKNTVEFEKEKERIKGEIENLKARQERLEKYLRKLEN